MGGHETENYHYQYNIGQPVPYANVIGGLTIRNLAEAGGGWTSVTFNWPRIGDKSSVETATGVFFSLSGGLEIALKKDGFVQS